MRKRKVSDGDRHEMIGHCVTGLMFLSMAQYSLWIAGAIAISGTMSVLFLSPDNDQVKSPYKSKSLHRWKRSGWLWVWQIFRLFPGTHHRGITHTPIIGAAVMLGWITAPAWTLMALLTWHWEYIPEKWFWVVVQWFGVIVFVPCTVQQCVHIGWDRLTSAAKKKRRKKQKRR